MHPDTKTAEIFHEHVKLGYSSFPEVRCIEVNDDIIDLNVVINICKSVNVQ